MNSEKLPILDSYIADHIGTATTRHASEERFACPALDTAVEAERTMRTTLHDMFDSQVALEYHEVQNDPAQSELISLKDTYWDLGRHVTAAHGAKPEYALDDYFHVPADRSYERIRSDVMEQQGPASMTGQLFLLLDRVQADLDFDPANASRFVTQLINVSLSSIKKSAAHYSELGHAEGNAATKAFELFIQTTAEPHVATLQQRQHAGENVKSLLNKRSTYPESTDAAFDDVPLRLKASDATGLARAYRIQERPYSTEELELAENIVQSPQMQRAMLLFHFAMVDDARLYLSAHPERAQHSLEPFTEIFVSLPREDGTAVLAPNPKLMKVIASNTVPAMARSLLENGQTLDDMTGDHVLKGVEMARKLRVFQLQIGQFNDYDPATELVSLGQLFPRTCPAMLMFSEALAKRLPDLFDESAALAAQSASKVKPV